jgi:hypothetical protein
LRAAHDSFLEATNGRCPEGALSVAEIGDGEFFVWGCGTNINFHCKRSPFFLGYSCTRDTPNTMIVDASCKHDQTPTLILDAAGYVYRENADNLGSPMALGMADDLELGYQSEHEIIIIPNDREHLHIPGEHLHERMMNMRHSVPARRLSSERSMFATEIDGHRLVPPWDDVLRTIEPDRVFFAQLCNDRPEFIACLSGEMCKPLPSWKPRTALSYAAFHWGCELATTKVQQLTDPETFQVTGCGSPRMLLCQPSHACLEIDQGGT